MPDTLTVLLVYLILLKASGSRRGAFAALGLGPTDNYVRIMRDQNGTWNSSTAFFQADEQTGSLEKLLFPMYTYNWPNN
jgi:hypothetical protein